jgi:hypothetical protein
MTPEAFADAPGPYGGAAKYGRASSLAVGEAMESSRGAGCSPFPQFATRPAGIEERMPQVEGTGAGPMQALS